VTCAYSRSVITDPVRVPPFVRAKPQRFDLAQSRTGLRVHCCVVGGWASMEARMRIALVVAGLVLSCIVVGCSPPTAVDGATSSAGSASASTSAAVNAVKARIVGVASPTASAVIVTWENSQFSVSIENSALNTSTHSARNSEAVTIAKAIAAAALNDSEFAGLLGVHVEYVARQAGASKQRIVDSIDFRKDSSGGMALHTT